MNKLFTALIIALGLNFSYVFADNAQNVKPISAKKIEQMDRKFTKHKAVKRQFKTQKEFSKRFERKNKNNYKPRNMRYNSNSYVNGDNYQRGNYNRNTYTRNNYQDNYRPMRQRGYNYSKRGWILAYRYDRAPFYDAQGYYYGYFNRYGYYFENIFYRYDRYYGYKDRVRGRGLFDRSYYMPSNARYYGFCTSRSPREEYRRNNIRHHW